MLLSRDCRFGLCLSVDLKNARKLRGKFCNILSSKCLYCDQILSPWLLHFLKYFKVLCGQVYDLTNFMVRQYYSTLIQEKGKAISLHAHIFFCNGRYLIRSVRNSLNRYWLSEPAAWLSKLCVSRVDIDDICRSKGGTWLVGAMSCRCFVVPLLGGTLDKLKASLKFLTVCCPFHQTKAR